MCVITLIISGLHFTIIISTLSFVSNPILKPSKFINTAYHFPLSLRSIALSGKSFHRYSGIVPYDIISNYIFIILLGLRFYVNILHLQVPINTFFILNNNLLSCNYFDCILIFNSGNISLTYVICLAKFSAFSLLNFIFLSDLTNHKNSSASLSFIASFLISGRYL